jgi:hypothetical protein
MGSASIDWSDLTFHPDRDTTAEAAAACAWLIPEAWTPVVCSVMGDIFLEKAAGGVFWLDCGSGALERVADDADQFRTLADAGRGEEWFLSGLVDALRANGKTLGPGQCYSFSILPVFAEGSYAPDNIYVVSAREHFGVAGKVHEQIRNRSDGEKVDINVVP